MSCLRILTRSSPQRWWGALTTAHILLDLCSIICGIGKSCTIVHGITSQPVNIFSNLLILISLSSPAVWLKLGRERLHSGEIRGWDRPIWLPAHGFLSQLTHAVSISYRFSLAGSKSVSASSSEPGTMTIRPTTLEAIASSSGKK